MSFFKILAIAGYSFLVLGLFGRRSKVLHVLAMGTGIFLDLTVVLGLQLQRHVIASAIELPHTFFQKSHIAVSTTALLLYLPVVLLGLQRLSGKGAPSARIWHIRLGLGAFFFRTLGLFLMFSF